MRDSGLFVCFFQKSQQHCQLLVYVLWLCNAQICITLDYVRLSRSRLREVPQFARGMIMVASFARIPPQVHLCTRRRVPSGHRHEHTADLLDARGQDGSGSLVGWPGPLDIQLALLLPR